MRADFQQTIFFILIYLTLPAAVSSGEDIRTVSLSPLVITAEAPSPFLPAGTYPAPISELRYHPSIELQIRNLPEAQADISIRGGIFSQTGFRIGPLTLIDPQTGHYSAEIPVPPSMLLPPAIGTGLRGDFSGFNATAGTVLFRWRPLETGGGIRLGIGDHHLDREEIYAACLFSSPALLSFLGEKTGFDLDLARSSGKGTRPQGDYDFKRIGLRLQIRGNRSQTDLFGGYQSKFFGWPDLYTPEEFLPTDETESIATTLVVMSHRSDYACGSFWSAGVYFRNNNDHYILQRDDPDLYQAFHRTRVWSGGWEGRHQFGFFLLDYRGQISADELYSTALVDSPYYSRTMAGISLLPQKSIPLGGRYQITVGAGCTLDDSNRASSSLSPLAKIEVTGPIGDDGENRFFCDYSGASQLPSYTAIGSPPSGLFGGNPDLGREKSGQVSAGMKLVRRNWNLRAAVFYRRDDDLVDWTYRNETPHARAADAVDIDTFGVELVFNAEWEGFYFRGGYTFLEKSYDYSDPEVTASFYALNYPRHRATAVCIWRLLARVELRAENEYRLQDPNSLRRGRRGVVLSALSMAYFPRFLPGGELTAAVDNPAKVNFEQIPGVPGPGRQVTLRLAYDW